MRALVVYESMFGHTEQVAHAIADGVSVHGDPEVREVESLVGHAGAGYDLIILGGPTHAFSMSRASTRADAIQRGATHGSQFLGIREWLEHLGRHRQDALVATFDTRVQHVRRLPGSAAKAAARRLRVLGFDAAAQPESFYVLDVDGPLVEGELDRARAWGATVARAALHHRTAAHTDR
jgi:flavodoxin